MVAAPFEFFIKCHGDAVRADDSRIFFLAHSKNVVTLFGFKGIDAQEAVCERFEFAILAVIVRPRKVRTDDEAAAVDDDEGGGEVVEEVMIMITMMRDCKKESDSHLVTQPSTKPQSPDDNDYVVGRWWRR